MYADLCRRLADEPLAHEIVGTPRWQAPLQLLGALHYLALRDAIDPWTDVRRAMKEHRDELARLATRPVQTNEVQRAWLLLPCFLEVARRSGAETFDLLELGPSAGLNLLWDRYRYVYAGGGWGPADAAIELRGEERGEVPADLLTLQPRVRARVGIDLDPVDLTTDEGLLHLKSFVWADQHDRLKRLDRAAAALRQDPPDLVRGDLVELLPERLAARADDSLTVVFQTAVLGYVEEERRRAVYDAVETAGADGRLAFVSAGQPEDGSHVYWGVSVTVWPGGEREIVEHANFHGAWIEWIGSG